MYIIINWTNKYLMSVVETEEGKTYMNLIKRDAEKYAENNLTGKWVIVEIPDNMLEE